MAAIAHLSHEVCPDALPYIDQDYEESGVRETVIKFFLSKILCIFMNYKCFKRERRKCVYVGL